MAPIKRPMVGQRVRLRNRVDRLPEFSVPEGATGTIDGVTPELISVRLDEPVAGAEGFGNCVYFYDATTYGAGQVSDGWDRFAEQVDNI